MEGNLSNGGFHEWKNQAIWVASVLMGVDWHTIVASLLNYRVVIILRPGRPEKIRPKALIGRIISGFLDQWTYHF